MPPYAPVTAPPVRAPRYGLLIAAQAVEDTAEGRWTAGFEFQPEACAQSGAVAAHACGNTAAMDAGDQAGIVQGDPIAVYASDRCSAFGFRARDWEARVRRQLEATRSFEIARELWTGTIRDAESLANRALVDVDSDNVTEDGPVGATAAMACLEQGLATCGKGRRGMIHCTPQTLVHWTTVNLVRFEAGQFLSPMGNVVVADAGYDGSGPGGEPADASQWAYATTMINVVLAPAMFTPVDSREAVDESVNTVTVWGVQLAALKWDECCHLAAELDLAVCTSGGAS